MRPLSLFQVATASASVVIPNIPRAPTEELEPAPTLFKRLEFQEPCAEVSASWAALAPEATGAVYVPASVAYSCLQSVPVDVEGDLKQIKELKNFIEFQTNLNYVKDGIKTHNEEPIDVRGSLDEIAADIQKGSYKSDYEVQLDLHRLFLSVGDNHFNWLSDILTVLPFVRAGGVLVSLSQDYTSLPDVFLNSDLAMAAKFNYTPSPIKTVNGKNATEYLNEIASQANYHDADARYNRLFPNQARRSIGLSADEDGPFVRGEYDGANTTFVFVNGTTKTIPNTAQIAASTNFTDVIDGPSFFKQFCQGVLDTTEELESMPTTTAAALLNATSTSTALSKTLPRPTGYPSPVIVQSSLALQGYYLNGSGYDDVAVLAIPEFGPTLGLGTNETDPAVETQKVLRAFLADARSKGKKKLVVDLRGNGGGTIVVGFEVFKQLFPGIVPYGASRYRAHEAFEVFSAAIADFVTNATLANENPVLYETIYKNAGTFDFQNVLNVSNQPFQSFRDYYGPYTNNNDTFIAARRYNFSNPNGGYPYDGLNLTGYLSNSETSPQPFEAENIVILQDGMCSSTCSIFSELMREQGKVQTIAIGGRPINAPMQGIGGTKGSQVLSFPSLIQLLALAVNFTQQVIGVSTAERVNATAVGNIIATEQLLIRSAHTNPDLPIFGRVNSLDNLRMNDSSETPLEFVYEAADCKLFNTFDSWKDVTKLWKASVDAKWGKGQCVSGSMGDKSSLSIMGNQPFNLQGKEQGNSTQQFQGAASGTKASSFMFVIVSLSVTLFLL
ncbi:uncharacterized protein BDR25DRAFT_313845 [Lindgomyces ingoldianus]|uniref:Uncharacterized protein n=1 Tax=Lindgomyces ingoldianus TaxID=673940 RepID=A0ACB6QW37_9PLEO|nr:uncharacterized protein BDR25DRAFT_313845 [Lindgomyces ingoldianus]KAF2471234.1 hypothetical protein BDR25DRAFT_313845 [Lindgomyces ingoldianus]